MQDTLVTSQQRTDGDFLVADGADAHPIVWLEEVHEMFGGSPNARVTRGDIVIGAALCTGRGAVGLLKLTVQTRSGIRKSV